MSKLTNFGEIAAAASDAYTAHVGGLSSPANSGAFGAAVASIVSTLFSTGRNPLLQGISTGLAPGANSVQLGINLGVLLNKNLTPAQRLGAGLGVLGAGAGLLAQITPPHFKTPCAKKPAKPSLSATTSTRVCLPRLMWFSTIRMQPH